MSSYWECGVVFSSGGGVVFGSGGGVVFVTSFLAQVASFLAQVTSLLAQVAASFWLKWRRRFLLR